MTTESPVLIENARSPGITHYVLSEAEQRLRLLERRVGHLISHIQDGEFREDVFSEVTHLLEVILLPAHDFTLARQHLQNSSYYCQLGEFGASAFELRIVRGILQRI